MNSPTRDSTFQQVEIEDSSTTSLKDSSPLNFFKKCIEKGSINECVINLCIISVGVGLLALPQKVQYVTLFLTPLLIIICAIINYWTFKVLGDAARKYKVNKYEDIIAAMFSPCFNYFFICVMCIGQFGIIILLLEELLMKFLVMVPLIWKFFLKKVFGQKDKLDYWFVMA